MTDEIENIYNDNSYLIESISTNSVEEAEEIALRPILIEDKTNEELKPKKERVYWVDCLRIFASMLVVYIHCTGINLKPRELFSYNWNALFFLNSLPRPCVPLFIMISGIFFLNPEKPLSLKKLYTKYIFHIFISFLFWSSYYNVIDYYIVFKRNFTYSNEELIEIFKRILLGGGHLWYLPFCMGLYIVTPLFRFVCTDRHVAWYIYWVCAFVSQIIPGIWTLIETFSYRRLDLIKSFMNNLSLYAPQGFVNYFILGYLLSSKEFTKKIYIYFWYLIGIIGIIVTVILRFASCHHLKTETNVFGEYNCINVAMGTVGIFTFFQYTVNKWIKPLTKYNFFRKLIFVLSDCSFGIYLIHMTIYNFSIFYLDFHPQSFDPLYCAPLFSAYCYIVSLVLTYLIRKIPILKKFT